VQKITIAEIDNSIQPAAVMRQLTEPLGLTDLAINYYELEPGDSLSYAYHDHEVQEEVFYVQAGTVTFETESGQVAVGTGEIVRFGREEFQRGWNRGDDRSIVLALGAPLEYGRQHKLRYCPNCESETDNELARASDETAVVARCKQCGTETGRWYRGSMDGEVP
jgi:uncharacterized cupin superfamily protein